MGTKGLGSGRWRLGWSSALADFHLVADSSVTDDMIRTGILTVNIHFFVGMDFNTSSHQNVSKSYLASFFFNVS